MKKIAVIGAGITGITTAYQLMKKGYDVTVFDRQKYAAMETSYANGGQYQHAMVKCGQTGKLFTKECNGFLRKMPLFLSI